MASKGAHIRLRKEYKKLVQDPPPFIVARPLESDLLQWYYVITGPPDTPYAGGQYFGLLRFPSDYPFKPPSVMMITPSGRFACSTRLCLSMSDFHPESWQVSWTVGTILTGLLSFMLEETPTTGSITSTMEERRAFAAASRAYNMTHPKFQVVFNDLMEEPATPAAEPAAEPATKPAA